MLVKSTGGTIEVAGAGSGVDIKKEAHIAKAIVADVKGEAFAVSGTERKKVEMPGELAADLGEKAAQKPLEIPVAIADSDAIVTKAPIEQIVKIEQPEQSLSAGQKSPVPATPLPQVVLVPTDPKIPSAQLMQLARADLPKKPVKIDELNPTEQPVTFTFKELTVKSSSGDVVPAPQIEAFPFKMHVVNGQDFVKLTPLLKGCKGYLLLKEGSLPQAGFYFVDAFKIIAAIEGPVVSSQGLAALAKRLGAKVVYQGAAESFTSVTSYRHTADSKEIFHLFRGKSLMVVDASLLKRVGSVGEMLSSGEFVLLKRKENILYPK